MDKLQQLRKVYFWPKKYGRIPTIHKGVYLYLYIFIYIIIYFSIFLFYTRGYIYIYIYFFGLPLRLPSCRSASDFGRRKRAPESPTLPQPLVVSVRGKAAKSAGVAQASGWLP